MLDVLIWIIFLAIVGGAVYYGLRARSSSLGETSDKLKSILSSWARISAGAGLGVGLSATVQATKAGIRTIPVRAINNLPDRCINPAIDTKKSATAVAHFIDLIPRNTPRHSLNIFCHLLRQE